MREKNKRSGRWGRRMICVVAGFLLSCLLVPVVICEIGKYQLKRQAVTASGEKIPETVVHNGQTYHYNTDLYVILCMGIDTTNDMVRDGEVGNARQSDANFLVILDRKNKTIKVVAIPRDTMTIIDFYDDQGRYAMSAKEHFALQFAYGDGGKASCVMTERTASRLMYGIPIHAYVCFNLRAIEVLNGMLGGVTVVPEEDFEDLRAGESITLNNEQAYRYVQSRDVDEACSAEGRLVRQKQYLTAFIQKAVMCTKADIHVPFQIYDQVSDHMITNVSDIQLFTLLMMGLQCEFTEESFYVVPGEQQIGNVYEEYHVDEEALYEMVLDVFYCRK